MSANEGNRPECAVPGAYRVIRVIGAHLHRIEEGRRCSHHKLCFTLSHSNGTPFMCGCQVSSPFRLGTKVAKFGVSQPGERQCQCSSASSRGPVAFTCVHDLCRCQCYHLAAWQCYIASVQAGDGNLRQRVPPNLGNTIDGPLSTGQGLQ